MFTSQRRPFFALLAVMTIFSALFVASLSSTAYATPTTTTFTAGQSGFWTVPDGVTSVEIHIAGGVGGDGGGSGGLNGHGGDAGMFDGTLTVVPGNHYAYHVGENGDGTSSPAAGGDGYTVGGTAVFGGGSGGGSTALIDTSSLTPNDILFIAGGGGGGGGACPAESSGGDGGGSRKNGQAYDGGDGVGGGADGLVDGLGGHGATTSADGAGNGQAGYMGQDGDDGDGGDGGTGTSADCGGGAGGAGLYGGGGGGAGIVDGDIVDAGGGGGGISYIKTGLTGFDFDNDDSGVPEITLTYDLPEETTTTTTTTTTVPSTTTTTVPAPGAAYGNSSTSGTTQLVSSPGKPVTISGSNFQPNSDVTVTLHSAPTVLGTATTNAQGSFTKTFTIPSSAALGMHTITLDGKNVNGDPATQTLGLTLVQLPETGSNLLVRVVPIASIILLGGIVFAFASRKRRLFKSGLMGS